MSPCKRRRRSITVPAVCLISLPILAGCSSLGDFGRLQDDLVSDDIQAWVGQAAAERAGAPISVYRLTDEERTLRDLAFPLIEPPYERQRWDAVLYEYGLKREFRRDLWVFDIAAYDRNLEAADFRSAAGRYNKLIDDIRNDVVRIAPFFDVAHRVLDIDRRRDESLRYIADLAAPERASALARIGENSLIVAWVQHSLTQRCAGYRFALERLIVSQPEKIAADAELALTQLQQRIAANQLVAAPRFAGAPPRLAAAAGR